MLELWLPRFEILAPKRDLDAKDYLDTDSSFARRLFELFTKVFRTTFRSMFVALLSILNKILLSSLI